MKETVEFRIPEVNAARYLPADVGERVGDSVRKVTVAVTDPQFAEIGRLHREFRARGEFFFLGREQRRTYSKRELEDAELFQLWPSRALQISGEEFGTRYDDSVACPECGAGAMQLSPLRLDLGKIGRSCDYAETLGGERIVSQAFAECLVDAGATGFELSQVSHTATQSDAPLDLKTVPAGREILRAAESAGAPHPTWKFWVWLNRPTNRAALEVAMTQHRALQPVHRWRKVGRVWYQFKSTAPRVELSPVTRGGSDPFDTTAEGRCSRGHVIGFNLLSEVTVRGCPSADVVETRIFVGARRGLLRPRSIVLVTPLVWKALRTAKVAGVSFEVAHVEH